MKHLLTLILTIGLALHGAAQGWERIVSGGAQDGGYGLTTTPDGGYAITGYYGLTRILVTKLDADGKIHWTRNLNGSPSFGSGRQIVSLQDGSLLVTGWLRSGLGVPADGFLAKLSPAGALLWIKTYGTPAGDDELNDLVLTPIGTVRMVGKYEQINGRDDFWMLETDLNGNVITDLKYGQWDLNEKANAISLAPNGDILLAGEVKELIDNDVLIMRLTATGTIIWSTAYGLDFVPTAPSSDRALDMALAPDGGIVVCGVTNASTSGGGGLILKVSADGSPLPIWYSAIPSTPLNGMSATQGGFLFTGLKEVTSTFEDVHILKTDQNGAAIWMRTIGKSGTDAGQNIITTPDGGTLSIGTSTPSLTTQDTYAYLVKTDAQGRVYTNVITGTLFQDLNSNCDLSSGEPALKEWIVKVISADNTRYAVTDAQGNFTVTVDTGNHIVSILPASSLWEPCQDEYPVSFSTALDSTAVLIPVRPSIICPNNVVDVQASLLRSCSDNTYYVRYCNQGTFPSPDTRIEVLLDPALSYVASSIPAVVTGNLVQFQVGYLDKGQCGDIKLTAFLRCDSILLGQAHCVTAHIYPDTICKPATNWDGAIIEAQAKCNDGEVKLSLKNKGAGNMATSLDFIVIEDVIQDFSIPTGFILEAGQDSVVFSRQANGKTYRIIASQSPGYPGESYPTAAVEGCQTDTTSNPISLGYYTMFPEDDANPFVSSNCLESISANQILPTYLKSGHPKGYDFNHYISPENDLTYVIRFTNRGSDTVKTVTIRDTLSAYLDPATVFPGAASHGYQFTVYGGGIVQFNLPNTDLLPDGSAPETRSSGFVSFRVAQKPNLACETEILNSAAVYFDYKAPETTNQVNHTVCNRDSFLLVPNHEVPAPAGAKITTYPNPFTDWVVFDLENIVAKQYTLQLYDIEGNLLLTHLYDHPTFRLLNSQIPAGITTYRLAADGRPVTAGKLMRVRG
jgi:uncharacterized repeat protein (TIGR01451 family)